MLSPTPPLPQVPWMSVGPSPSWTPTPYPWAATEATLPLQVTSPLVNLSCVGQANMGIQNQSQVVTQPTVPVTTMMMTTTMPAGAQPPTLIPAPMMNELSVRDAAGNLQLKIANHAGSN